MVLLTIVKKLLGESRWALGSTVVIFFGLATLWNWSVSLFQERMESLRETIAEGGDPADSVDGEQVATENSGSSDQDSGSTSESTDENDNDREEEGSRRRGRSRGAGFFLALGVPQDLLFDPEGPLTLAMQVCFANHPVIILTLMGLAIARGSGSVAGEIERGTLDLTMTRPVRRITYIGAQILSTLIMLLVSSGALIVAHLLAPLYFEIDAPGTLLELLPSYLMTVAFGLSIFSLTLIFSARDLSRVRAAILGIAVTLSGVAALVFTQTVEGYDWVTNISIFEYYAPVGFTLDPTGEYRTDLGVLVGVFAVGSTLGALLFLRRDLPTSG